MAREAAITWSWKSAAHGVALSLPAVAAAVFDPAVGMALAVGCLPAAALGLRESRRERRMVVVIGAVVAVSIFLGSLVAPFPVLAVLMVFTLCVTVAVSAADASQRMAPPRSTVTARSSRSASAGDGGASGPRLVDRDVPPEDVHSRAVA